MTNRKIDCSGTNLTERALSHSQFL